ncbi:MAG: PE-PPE domain-containing protein, partial [Mycobacterium sp.]
MAQRVDPTKYRWSPIPYAAALPFTRSVASGITKLTDAINSTDGEFAIAAYSQGAMVVAPVYRSLRSGPLAHRKSDLRAVVAFANPAREAGHTFPGCPDNQPYLTLTCRTFAFICQSLLSNCARCAEIMHRSSYFRLLRPARLAVALLAFAAFASADSFIDAYNIDSNRGGFMWIDENGVPTNVYAGVIDIALTENGQTYNRDTLCVDLFTDIDQYVTYGTQVLDPSMVPGRNLGQVAWLIDNALMPAQNQNYSSVLPSIDWVT